MKNPHDRFIREALSNIENAVSTFTSMLPDVLTELIDWSTLRLLPQILIDKTLQLREADLLFEVEMQGHQQGRTLQLCLILEAQRNVDKFMRLRLVATMGRLWDRWLRTQQAGRQGKPGEARAWPPPILLPIVLYHGSRTWNSSVQFADLFELNEDAARVLSPYLPHFEFVLDDLAAASDEDIVHRTLNASMKVVLGALKHGPQPVSPETFFNVWDSALRELLTQKEGREQMATMLYYLLQVNPSIKSEELGVMMSEQLGREARTAATTAGERLIEQGREEGWEKGREEGQAKLLLALLSQRFGEIPTATREAIRGASSEMMLRWTARILEAETLDAVFLR